ncbi:hypothetical protein T440DRAFT_415462 [Plenodomus tracheiphilus IPT5]|uniref:MARVEL domain-containing protein n=1 Tax=Plenodomus tracheiphilus IPT5 TaxID=1408161 RepID=A0A6A7BIN1_9PLEO|nr:hypothetical protein T440DRAFT_415462 [Plenodomus tracheiphilus IPT5]
MKMNATHPLRALQVALSITILGLMIYVSSWWTRHWRQSAPSEVNFLIFTPAWSLASLIPLLLFPLRFSHLLATPSIRYGLLTLEALTMLYWFAGFIALAVFLNDRVCFGMVCDVARAGAGISALSWVVWAGSFGVGVWAVIKERRAGGMGGEKKVQMMQGV